MVGLIDLCSKNSTALLTPVALRDLLARAAAGERFPLETPQVQKLSSRLGKEVCDQICGRYAAGESAKTIAADYGIVKNSVLKLVRSQNIVVRVQGPTNEQVKRAVKLYKSGTAIAEIQKEVGSSYGAIRRALLRAKVPMRPRGFQPRAD